VTTTRRPLIGVCHTAPRSVLATLVLAVTALTATAGAQELHPTRPGKRVPLAKAREIALARSAAPSEVSKDATIYVLTDTGFAVASEGTNGNACFVNRSWPDALEPHCFDPEARATVMQMELARMRGIQRGTAPAEVDRDLAEGIRSGKYRLPQRPAMTYMMSGAQQLIGDDGKPVGRWQPHLMLFVPYVTGPELGLGLSPNPAAAIVVSPGTPLANIMVVVKNFVEPAEVRPDTR
jgi:hypothetical protein